MTKIDETTGLPELPEGYFWRVIDGYDVGTGLGTYPGVEVVLMKTTTKLRWFKRVPTNREVGSCWTHRNDIQPGGVPDAIKDLAQTVYRRAKSQLPIHDEVAAEIAQYAGDYPPKKLEA